MAIVRRFVEILGGLGRSTYVKLFSSCMCSEAGSEESIDTPKFSHQYEKVILWIYCTIVL